MITIIFISFHFSCVMWSSLAGFLKSQDAWGLIEHNVLFLPSERIYELNQFLSKKQKEKNSEMKINHLLNKFSISSLDNG